MRSKSRPSLPQEVTSPAICRKCGALLTPGHGDFYVVGLEAYAENSPPIITAEDLAKDHGREMQQLVAQLKEFSPQEMMDMVHRHMTFFLCTTCYKTWIESPTG